MPRRDIPQHWSVLMDRKGINSARKLAERAGMSHGTAVRIIFGDGYMTTEDNLQKVAKALDVDMKTVYALVGRNTPIAEEWTPPAGTARLTQEQRKVLEDLIRVMLSTPAAPEPASDFEQRRQERLALMGHPEQGELRLAADRSHGPSLTQQWDDEDDA